MAGMRARRRLPIAEQLERIDLNVGGRMFEEDTGFDGGWEEASDHGHRLADWIGAQENYSHPDYPGRDVDGRFNRRFSVGGLDDED